MGSLAQISNVIGITGVLLTLFAYYFLSVNKLSSSSLMYLLLNFVGAWLILFSLLFHWNWSSVLIEIAWIVISIIGIYRYFKARNVIIQRAATILTRHEPSGSTEIVG